MSALIKIADYFKNWDGVEQSDTEIRFSTQELREIINMDAEKSVLERRHTPKKPIEKHYEEDGELEYIKYSCPNRCGVRLYPVTEKKLACEHEYCNKCGQKIEWEGAQNGS